MHSVSKILRSLFDIHKDDKNGLKSDVWRERERQRDGDRKRNTQKGVVCMVCERGKIIFACLIGGKCLSIFLCMCARVHMSMCILCSCGVSWYTFCVACLCLLSSRTVSCCDARW